MNKVRILKSSFLYSSIYSETSKTKLKKIIKTAGYKSYVACCSLLSKNSFNQLFLKVLILWLRSHLVHMFPFRYLQLPWTEVPVWPAHSVPEGVPCKLILSGLPLFF